MKKFYRTMLALAGGLLILGALLAAAGLLLGAPLSTLAMPGPFGARLFPHLSYSGSQSTDSPAFSQSYEGVRSLEIQGGQAVINIATGNSFSIDVLRPLPDFFSQVRDGHWVICSGGHQDHQLQPGEESEITITLPEDFVAEQLRMELGISALSASRLAARKAELEVSLGSLEIKKLDCPDLSLDVGMGSAEITLAGREDEVAFQVENAMGSVTVGSHRWEGLSLEEHWNSDAPNQAEISCSMGEVTINWED